MIVLKEDREYASIILRLSQLWMNAIMIEF